MFEPSKLFVDQPAVEAPAFTPDLKGLANWLETKNPHAAYDYNNCEGECLLDQFGAVSGLDYYGDSWTGDNGLGLVALIHPWTYGAALERARAAL